MLILACTVTELLWSTVAELLQGTANALPKSATGKALNYFINQEKYLRVFLTDGHVPRDNSMAERSIRVFVTGRKKWQVLDTIKGAKANAFAYSMSEIAKANCLKPYEYFEYLLEELPKQIILRTHLMIILNLDDLLPWSESLTESCRKTEKSKEQS